MRVLIEAMNIAYGVEEWRSPWRRRLGHAIDDGFGLGGILGPLWRVLYWPITISLSISMLTTLYHIAPNWRTPWRRDLPGAVLAGALWVTAAFGLRAYVDLAISETTLGPLAAPVVMLLWLYVTALSVLLGAELNAEIDKAWPTREAGPKQPSAA